MTPSFPLATMLALLVAPDLATAEVTPVNQGRLLAIRARQAETVANGTLEHAVILIEGDKIVTVGADLPIERGIPVLELPDDWVIMPGLVNAYTRLGLEGNGPSDSRPGAKASDELYPAAKDYAEALKAGVTTLGQYPAGSGIPGQAVAVHPPDDKGKKTQVADMVLRDGVYMKIVLRSTGGSKRMLTTGFKKVDDFLEKEKKNREKWDKEQEKAKKKKKSPPKKKDDEKKAGDEKKADPKKAGDEEKADPKKDDAKKKEEAKEYVPLVPEPEVKAFMDLRDKKLPALVSISKAGDLMHFLDALDDEEIDWHLRIPLTRSIDVFHVEDKITEAGCRVVVEPSLTLHPGTMRQRNLSAEMARAGAKVVFVPRTDSVSGYRSWLRHVGEIVAAGFDRQTALRALTLEPASMLGLQEQIGSIEAGKAADLVILDGDPFEPTTRIRCVMLAGEIVYGEVDL